VRGVLAAAVLGFATHALETAAQPRDGFVELFTGSLDGWRVEGDANIGVVDGVLRVEEPQGWLASARQYADFELRIEFRFLTDDADSGIFMRTLGAATFARGWPNASYQVQLRNPLGDSPFPAVGGVFRHGMPSGPTDFDASAAAAASRPTGEWQTLEIELASDSLTVVLNGVDLTSAANIEPSTGHIGIQAETGGIEFRSIAIRVL
jgi:hypothetical protein